IEASSATISSTITRHAGYIAMAISCGGTVAQTAPLSVASLDVSGFPTVTLTNAGNDVDTLAGSAAAITGATFSYREANGFAVGNVGIHPGVFAVGGSVTLTSGGAITDGNGSAVNVTAASLTATAPGGIDLDLAGGGTVTASLSGNELVTLSTTSSTTIIGASAGTNGSVTLGTAALTLQVARGFTPAAGTQFVIIDNDGTDAVTGTFARLPE